MSADVLVALLRVALALDRRRTAVSVKSVTVEQDADSAVILAEPAPLEVTAADSAHPHATPDLIAVSRTLSPSIMRENEAASHLEVHDIALELWAARKELANLSLRLGTPVSIIEGGDASPLVTSSSDREASDSEAPSTPLAPASPKTLHSALLSSLLVDTVDLPAGDGGGDCVSSAVHTSLLDVTDTHPAHDPHLRSHPLATAARQPALPTVAPDAAHTPEAASSAAPHPHAATPDSKHTPSASTGGEVGPQPYYSARAPPNSAIQLEWNMQTDTDGHVRARLGAGNGLRDGDAMLLASMDSSIAMEQPFGGWGRPVEQQQQQRAPSTGSEPRAADRHPQQQQ